MRRSNQQAGISMLGVLVILVLLSFFLVLLLRLLPAYMEGRSVRTSIESVAAASDVSSSIRDIKRGIAASFDTNRIESVAAKDVKIIRQKQKIVIDASHEARIPLFDGIDVVLIFDDVTATIE
jgi:hypothetical protein